MSKLGASMIDARQLAAELGVTVEQVNRLARRGRFPRYHCGHRTYRYKLDEVLAALREPSAPAPSQGVVVSVPTPPPPAPLPSYDWSHKLG